MSGCMWNHEEWELIDLPLLREAGWPCVPCERVVLRRKLVARLLAPLRALLGLAALLALAFVCACVALAGCSPPLDPYHPRWRVDEPAAAVSTPELVFFTDEAAPPVIVWGVALEQGARRLEDDGTRTVGGPIEEPLRELDEAPR